MPNGDRTGPDGKGPRTGRGMGQGQGRGRGAGCVFGGKQMPQINATPDNVKLKDKMKVVISATGETIDSEIDTHFGRCPYFVIVEIENKEIKSVTAVENYGDKQTQGAGITAAEQVAKLKPDIVITGRLGPRAVDVLNQFNIKTLYTTGKINEVLQKQFLGG